MGFIKLDSPKNKLRYANGVLLAGFIIFFRYTETGEDIFENFIKWMLDTSPWLFFVFMIAMFSLFVWGVVYLIRYSRKKDKKTKLFVLAYSAIPIVAFGILIFIVLFSLWRAIGK